MFVGKEIIYIYIYISLIQQCGHILHKADVFLVLNCYLRDLLVTCSKYSKLTNSVLLLLRASWLCRIKWWCITWNEKILYSRLKSGGR